MLHDNCIIDTNFADPGKWSFKSEIGRTEGTPVEGRIRFSNAEASLVAAEAGLGLACVPGFVAGAAIRAGRVSSQ